MSHKDSFRCCGFGEVIHSFPTRRSSDLVAGSIAPGGVDTLRVTFDAAQYRDGDYAGEVRLAACRHRDRKSTRLNSSHLGISYAVFCLKKKILGGRGT